MVLLGARKAGGDAAKVIVLDILFDAELKICLIAIGLARQVLIVRYSASLEKCELRIDD